MAERSSEPTMTQAFALISGLDAGRISSAKRTTASRRCSPPASPARTQVDELFWTALTRAPSPPESAKLVALLDTAPDKQAALEDILWGLRSTRRNLCCDVSFSLEG
jgi:hypothetical protein